MEDLRSLEWEYGLEVRLQDPTMTTHSRLGYNPGGTLQSLLVTFSAFFLSLFPLLILMSHIDSVSEEDVDLLDDSKWVAEGGVT